VPPPDLVIFDCDGVLVDSERLSHTVLQQMLAEIGVELTLAQTFDHFMGASTARCRAVLDDLLGRAAPGDFMDRFGTRCFAAFAEGLGAVPGVPDLLAALSVPYCVASNGPHEKMRFTLGRTGLLPLFEGRRFSADDVAQAKPAPDLFLHAARTLSAPPHRCVVIEDSPTGIAAARAAGMTVFGYAASTPAARLRDAGADAVFERMHEVPALLARAAR
jgi:HAD superfamily hydrolase (TIGR01509 family)